MNADSRIPTDAELEALARSAGECLSAAGQTVATAESCTGGWIAKTLTDVVGSSGWVVGGIVSYSNEAKSRLLGVPPALVEAHGAVSEAVVRAMAAGAREHTGADLAVAVSGIAGPDGGSADKPVGTVWFAWASAAGVAAECVRFDGGRETVRRRTVAHALDGLIRVASS
jgi:nicotinamide-nucleotide amidase